MYHRVKFTPNLLSKQFPMREIKTHDQGGMNRHERRVMKASSAKFPLHSLTNSFVFKITSVSLLDMLVTEIFLALTCKKVAWASVSKQPSRFEGTLHLKWILLVCCT
jgi:hypothetical protein